MRKKQECIKVQIELSENSPQPIQEALAWCSQDKNVLNFLSKSKFYKVRKLLANRSNCPDSVLLTLSKDKAKTIRYCVSQNSFLPKEAIKNLSTEEEDLDVLTTLFHVQDPATLPEIFWYSLIKFKDTKPGRIGHIKYIVSESIKKGANIPGVVLLAISNI